MATAAVRLKRDIEEGRVPPARLRELAGHFADLAQHLLDRADRLEDGTFTPMPLEPGGDRPAGGRHAESGSASRGDCDRTERGS